MTIQQVLAQIPNLSAFARGAGLPYNTVRHLAKNGQRPGKVTLRKMLAQVRRERDTLGVCEGALSAMLEAKR